METSHEYDMAMLTASNHGEAHKYLRHGWLTLAVKSLFEVLAEHNHDASPMERQRVILEVLSRWQRQFDNPDCDE